MIVSREVHAIAQRLRRVVANLERLELVALEVQIGSERARARIQQPHAGLPVVVTAGNRRAKALHDRSRPDAHALQRLVQADEDAIDGIVFGRVRRAEAVGEIAATEGVVEHHIRAGGDEVHGGRRIGGGQEEHRAVKPIRHTANRARRHKWHRAFVSVHEVCPGPARHSTRAILKARSGGAGMQHAQEVGEVRRDVDGTKGVARIPVNAQRHVIETGSFDDDGVAFTIESNQIAERVLSAVDFNEALYLGPVVVVSLDEGKSRPGCGGAEIIKQSHFIHHTVGRDRVQRFKVAPTQDDQIFAGIRAHAGEHQIGIAHGNAAPRSGRNWAAKLPQPGVQKLSRSLGTLQRSDACPHVKGSERAEQVEAAPRCGNKWAGRATQVRVPAGQSDVTVGQNDAMHSLPVVRPIKGGTGDDVVGHQPGGGRKAGAGTLGELHPRHVNGEKECVVIGISHTRHGEVGEWNIHKNVVAEARFKFLPARAPIHIRKLEPIQLRPDWRRNADAGAVVPTAAACAEIKRILHHDLKRARGDACARQLRDRSDDGRAIKCRRDNIGFQPVTGAKARRIEHAARTFEIHAHAAVQVRPVDGDVADRRGFARAGAEKDGGRNRRRRDRRQGQGSRRLLGEETHIPDEAR